MRSKGDPDNLMPKVMSMGCNLKTIYSEDRMCKAPSDYSHGSVTMSHEHEVQMKNDIAQLKEMLVARTQPELVGVKVDRGR